jgi:formamidopyrimidine-DNA glycosylase
MEGRRILRLEQRRADLRFPLPARFAERVANARIDRLARQAKFLAAHLSTGEVLVMHLGMTGRFTIGGGATASFHHDPGGAPAHDHVVFHMEGGEPSPITTRAGSASWNSGPPRLLRHTQG